MKNFLFGDNLYVNILPTTELVFKTVEISAKFKLMILELPHILISGYAEGDVDETFVDVLKDIVLSEFFAIYGLSPLAIRT